MTGVTFAYQVDDAWYSDLGLQRLDRAACNRYLFWGFGWITPDKIPAALLLICTGILLIKHESQFSNASMSMSISPGYPQLFQSWSLGQPGIRVPPSWTPYVAETCCEYRNRAVKPAEQMKIWVVFHGLRFEDRGSSPGSLGVPFSGSCLVGASGIQSTSSSLWCLHSWWR